MYSLLKNLYKCKVLKARLSKKGFAKNSVFSLLPSIFLRAIHCPLLLMLLLMSCKENPTTPSEPPKPPGYQEDIPWPSLADSPWPMNHHDPQSTGRSRYVGPMNDSVYWILNLDYNQTSAVIGTKDLFIAPTGNPRGFLNITRDGKINWQKVLYSGSTYEIQTTPC